MPYNPALIDGKVEGMARELNRLSALQVKNASKPGLLADGGGLYLHISTTGSKSWIYRYMLAGRRRDMGLGPLHTINLAEARQLALACRKHCLDGLDPIRHRESTRTQQAIADSKDLTFAAVAERWLNAHRSSWSNAKHIYQNEMHLRKIAGAVLGPMLVPQIGTDEVMRVLTPLWNAKTETANRVRNKIELVLDYAKVSGYREGDNPARWKGHLDHLLPKPTDIQQVQHMAAMPYKDVPGFMKTLRGRQGSSARALEFLILTASRTSETLHSTPSEINTAEKHWTVPKERMKGKKNKRRAHRVPLSPQALDLLDRSKSTVGKANHFLFPGPTPGKPLSNMALLMQLRRMGHKDITTHGFRSTFRTWAGETTNHPREVIESALAHIVGNTVENAYWRGDMYERRIALMNDWGAFCAGLPAPKQPRPRRAPARSAKSQTK